ncbi:uncharacterized protein BCR38DRAFT_425254, partial [Pseudomassariella vexata]
MDSVLLAVRSLSVSESYIVCRISVSESLCLLNALGPVALFLLSILLMLLISLILLSMPLILLSFLSMPIVVCLSLL